MQFVPHIFIKLFLLNFLSKTAYIFVQVDIQVNYIFDSIYFFIFVVVHIEADLSMSSSFTKFETELFCPVLATVLFF